jgi:hypothetical protein
MRAHRALWAALALAAALAAAARAQAPAAAPVPAAAPAERQVPTFAAPGFSPPEEATRREVAGLASPEACAFVAEAGGGLPRALLPPGLPARLASSLANADPSLS